METKSSIIYPILKSFLPLFAGGIYHLCKETFTRPDDDTNLKEILAFDFLNQVSFGIYTNPFAFLLVMFLIDGLLQVIQKGFWKEAKLSKNSFNSSSSSSSQKRNGVFYLISKKQIMSILVYALIFISLQIARLGFLSFSQSKALTNHSEPLVAIENYHQEDHFGIPRLLEEIKEEAVDNELVTTLSSSSIPSDKISLSMGSILGSLNLNVKTIVLTKDRKIAYATLDYYGTLKVIDISDLQSPFVISTLNLPGSYTHNYLLKNLLLSSDEKTLYASNSRELEIIDVTDPSSPKLISLTISEIFKDDLFGYMKTSLAIEENAKTLYIGGLGLQVYDVSDPKKPALLKALKNDWSSNVPQINELCLSRDGQVLFIANGTLDIYNISNPRDLKLLKSFETESSPRSVLLSDEGRTAFLLGVSTNNSEVIVEEVDVSNYDSLKVRNTVHFGYKSIEDPRILALSPSKAKLFIMASPRLRKVDLLVVDRVKKTTTKNEKSLIEDTFALDFSPDSRTLITASNGQFRTIELFLDYPNSQVFSESLDNVISKFSVGTTIASMQVSNDGKYLFILRGKSKIDSGSYPIFEIWDVRNPSEPRLSSSYNWDQSASQMHVMENSDTVYLRGDNSILVLDIRNRDSIKVKKTYNSIEKNQEFCDFTISPDEKTGFLILCKDGLGDVAVFDLSESSPSIIEANVASGTQFKVSYSKLIVKDENTLILFLQGSLRIYGISNLDAPKQIAALNFCLNEAEPEVSFALLSPDKKTFYIETSDKSASHKLRIYDLSIPTSPELLSEKSFSKLEFLNRKPGFSLSAANLKTGFIYQNNTLVKLDLETPKEIKISGIIPLLSDQDRQTPNYLVSPDGQTLYASVEGQIRIVNMNIKYTVFLKKEKFLLGEKYSGSVALLNLTGNSSDYNLVDSESYKITKLSLLDMNFVPNQYSLESKTSLLPSWVTFDSESDSLAIEAKKQRDIGTYTLHSAFSLKIPRGVFDDLLRAAKRPASSKNLWAWLISLNYVDNELFLTANFGSEDTFFLPDDFDDYSVQIYSILKKYHVETSTRFEIVSSLKVGVEEKNQTIQISTLSVESIKVEVQLAPKNGSDVKFVSCPYGSITPVVKNNNKTKISLEGSMREINTAVNSIVVNFENGGSCDASVVINDGFNPALSVGLKNISRYFKANGPPRLNSRSDKTVQEQIDSADIQTGKYFTFTLTEDIFEDENVENLSYELAMANNGTAFPTWLSFNGLTLKGTPPKEVLGRDIDLILVAKNEFKQVGVPLTLHVKISLAFWLELALKYAPYVLTIVGLLVSANKIFNILGKRYYKHFKEFYFSVGQEISPALIEPISFIGEELDQSRLILKYLMKSGGNQLLSSFVDPTTGILDKQKILEMTQKAVNKMLSKDRQKLTKYPSPVIDKIIVNKFVLMQLKLESEARTKDLFTELKPDCMEAVERDVSSSSSSSLEFTINEDKLKNLIKRIRPLEPQEVSEALEESLMRTESNALNIELLKDAILAFAFENHSVDISPIYLDIQVKQKIASNFLWKFLKLDLRDIYLNEKTKINYGIDYQIVDDKLCFYGVTQSYFKGKTIIVQVKTHRQRIMKEIWIHGVSSNSQKGQGEQENRGQGYEVY